MVSYVLALEEIAAADGGLSTVMSVTNSPDCAALLAYGSSEQKELWLKPFARGEIVAIKAIALNAAISESILADPNACFVMMMMMMALPLVSTGECSTIRPNPPIGSPQYTALLTSLRSFSLFCVID